VWVSVGSMAASGGYYCAVAGDKIYVNPSSIVGSIGVVGGRLAMDDLYKMAKVNVVPHTRGPMAGIFRSTTPWTPEEVEAVRAKMKQTYDVFTSRVTAGRKGIDLSKTAEGRLFTGDKAIGMKMADKVGGLEVALADFASELKLEEYDVMDFPGPKSLEDLLKQVMGSVPGASAPGVSGGILSGEIASMGRKVFGEAAWDQISTNMTGLMELRKEPVILMSPSVLVIR
jgi:protease-4